MDKMQFSVWIADVYAKFGKSKPSQDVMRVIFERVELKPDGFFSFAMERLEDYTALPANIGRELVRVIWPEYLERNPILKASESPSACPACAAGLAGAFWGWDENGKRFWFKCECNQDPQLAHLQSWSHRLAKSQGYSLTEPLPENPVSSWQRKAEQKPTACVRQNGPELPF